MAWSFGDWYAKNGTDLNKKRKARYREDEAYRQKVLKEAKDRRDAARLKKTQERGVPIGEAAASLGVNVSTIKTWETKGWIPNTQDEKGIRRYRMENLPLMFCFVQAAAHAHPRSDEYKMAIAAARARIEKEWVK